MISQRPVRGGRSRALPTRATSIPPAADSSQPYFSTWVTQQLVDRYGPGDRLRRRARDQDDARPRAPGRGRAGDLGPPRGRRAERLAGRDRQQDRRGEGDGRRHATSSTSAFNLATNGHRQPGSAFKPFTLVARSRTGSAPSRPSSRRRGRSTSRSGPFEVNNYEDNYSGVDSLRTATDLRQLRVRRARATRSARAGRADGAARWASAPRSRRTPR